MLAPNARRVHGKDGWELRDCTTGKKRNRYIVITEDGEREEVYAETEWDARDLMWEWRSKRTRRVTKCKCGMETNCGYECPYEIRIEPEYRYSQPTKWECDYQCERENNNRPENVK